MGWDGTPQQRERWLQPLVAGEIVGAFATTEPEASTDLSPEAVQTVAERHGDGWILLGRKRWTSTSPVAGFIVALARTSDCLSMFIVDTRLPGVRVGEPDLKMGNRGQLTADVYVYFDKAVAHLSTRQAFGRPAAANQH